MKILEITLFSQTSLSNLTAKSKRNIESASDELIIIKLDGVFDENLSLASSFFYFYVQIASAYLKPL